MDDMYDQILAGAPLMLKALDAISLYQEARNSNAPTKKVERLRVQAEWLFDEMQDYHLGVMSGSPTARDLHRC